MALSFSAEVAEELCKTAASGHALSPHPFSHDMPLLPSKSRTLKMHAENKENIEGGLDGRQEPSTHGPSGTRLARLHARRLRRMAAVYLAD